ncbi:MAG: hypothetical protein GY701_22445 [Sulfitobacter sp.]|nr:hypothetical protein [Sulfitobacter sp.]
MNIEGNLSIELSMVSGRVDRVKLDSCRPVHACRVFHGRSVAEVLKMLPMLFTVCTTAQACAGVRACEQALGIPPTFGLEGIRQALVRMETLREHLWRILLDWPGFLGEAPQQEGMTEMLALQREYRHVLTAGYDPFLQPGDVSIPAWVAPYETVRKLAAVLEQAVFGMAPADWLVIDSPDKMKQWAASGVTVAARLLNQVIKIGWSGAGRCDARVLPVLNTEALHRLLEHDDFVETPQWSGNCCETTCFTRADSALLGQLCDHYGNGLLARLAARLTELAQLPGTLLTDSAGDRVGEWCKNNPGIGEVTAARGQLLHRVCIEDGRVVRYQILAPTEWNFHPQGVVAKCLETLCGDAAQVERQARMLINAIDPCVGYKLSIV